MIMPVLLLPVPMGLVGSGVSRLQRLHLHLIVAKCSVASALLLFRDITVILENWQPTC